MNIEEFEKYRNNKELWSNFSYQERGENKIEGYSLRCAALLHLQYECIDSDEELVRHLFVQEIIARENDNGEGCLDLAAYLLACFKNRLDRPLFHRAKNCDFDAACGFDLQYSLVALRSDKTKEANFYAELVDLGMEDELDFDEWWHLKKKLYPCCEKDEDLLSLCERYHCLNDVERAMVVLDKWRITEPDSASKNQILKFYYKELGALDQAIIVQDEIIQSVSKPWDIASALTDMIELYRLTMDYQGLKVIQRLNLVFLAFDQWKELGLGRMAVVEALEFALVIDSQEVTLEVFQIVSGWLEKVSWIPFDGLELAWKVAEKSGLVLEANKFKFLAGEERKRIDRMLGK